MKQAIQWQEIPFQDGLQKSCPWLALTLLILRATLLGGAGVSKAKSRGANPNQIMLQGDWTNVRTFEKHYNRPILGPALSDLILDH